jgi:type I site-specific restriction endonuclease
MLQVREEVSFTKGRIIVRGKLVTRGQAKRADYVLYFKPNIPLALIEAKDNSHSVGDGIQQMSRSRAICRALITLDVPKIDGVAITMQPQGDKPRLWTGRFGVGSVGSPTFRSRRGHFRRFQNQQRWQP